MKWTPIFILTQRTKVIVKTLVFKSLTLYQNKRVFIDLKDNFSFDIVGASQAGLHSFEKHLPIINSKATNLETASKLDAIKNETIRSNIKLETDEGLLKMKKNNTSPKTVIEESVPMLVKHLQKYSDFIISNFKLDNDSDTALTHPKLRVLATIIDSIFIIPLFIIMVPVMVALSTIGLGFIGVLLQSVLSLAIIMYYYQIETSEHQGSIGKTLCRIKIVNKDNQVMTSQQAITRNLFKFSPMLIGNIVSILIIPFSFFGLLSGLLSFLSGLLSFFLSIGVTVAICYAFFNKTRQGVHDMLAKTYVIGNQHDLPSNLEALGTK